MNIKSLLLITIFILSIVMGGVEFYLNSLGEFITERTQTIWGVIFVLLSIMWATHDTKQSNFSKPLDFGFLMYVFWPVAFPYYLLATRGIEGILYVLGFALLWVGPWVAGLVAYIYVYPG